MVATVWSEICPISRRLHSHGKCRQGFVPNELPYRPARGGSPPMSQRSESPPELARWANVELPRPLEARPQISDVLFDFDGTLSLIRQGWPEVMVPMFVEALPRRAGETEESLRTIVLDD